MGKFKLALLGLCPICLTGLQTQLKRKPALEIAGIFTPEDLLSGGQAPPEPVDLWIVYFDGSPGVVKALALERGEARPLVYPLIAVYNRSDPPQDWARQTHHASAFLLHDTFAQEISLALKVIKLGGIYVTGKLKNRRPLTPAQSQLAVASNGLTPDGSDPFFALLSKLYPQLSPGEIRILKLLRDDPSLSYKEAGSKLGITEETIKKHMSNIGDKLGVNGRKAILKLLSEQVNEANGGIIY
ncbi:MAG: LuxR C-terminal-related transcriptional regulator [Firmicutes bacterium]|nr:LuxR C-terminal-related transcriptional regulator [Bacillota bacterium]MCL5038429.1 LuxR C-terminal-related transcriptional regulator [Bacillota bacterium]